VPDASYPNFTGKHAGEALFTAADFVAYLRRVGVRGDEPAPAGVILCYQPSLYAHVLRAEVWTARRRGGCRWRCPVPGAGWDCSGSSGSGRRPRRSRETVAEARHYQAEGVLCVEMEAAALFAVAQMRGLALASAFVISDSLAEEAWSPRFRDPAVQGGLVRLYQAAVAVLAAGLGGSGGSGGSGGLVGLGE
jgi:hypothetical protein